MSESEEAPKKIKVDYYVDLVLRRRWLLIISFGIAMIGGMFVSITTPKMYESDTLILVEPKSIPDKYVEPLTEVDVKQRVSTITQKVKSRTYIEQVIDRANLFEAKEYENMLMEEKIAVVRKNMNVKVTRGRKGADSFRISFKGKNPKKITEAVNILADYFIDESIEVMQAEVTEAQKFLEEELRAKAEKLIDVENNLKAYRTEYMGGLPEQLSSNLGMLSGLRSQLTSKQESLRDEKMRLIQMEGQLSEVRRELEGIVIPESEVIIEEKPVVEIKPSENEIRLAKLKDQYANLVARYTSQHPDVVKTGKMVAELEAIVSEERKERERESEREKEKAASAPVPIPRPVKKTKEQLAAIKYKSMKTEQFKGLESQIQEVKFTIKQREKDIAKIVLQIQLYEKRVEDTPKREQELMALTRDYKNIQDTYNSILRKKLDADVAVSMERKAKGQRFRVLDKAQVPKKPVSPDVKKLLIMSVAGGLAVGGGLIFLLDFIDTSLRQAEDIESLTGIPVLATIPNIQYRPIDKIKQRVDQGLSFIFVMVDVGLLCIFGILALKGVPFLKKLVPGMVGHYIF